MSAMSNYLENKIIDWLLRNQAFTPPDPVYIALLTAAPSDTGGGTEVTGGSYARVAVASSLTNWAGTQAAGSTSTSSGTDGTTSNNNDIVFPTPTANWGLITHFGLYDSSSGGQLLFWAPVNQQKNVNNGDAAPKFIPAALGVQIDN